MVCNWSWELGIRGLVNWEFGIMEFGISNKELVIRSIVACRII
jgi:hypothetical protein